MYVEAVDFWILVSQISRSGSWLLGVFLVRRSTYTHTHVILQIKMYIKYHSNISNLYELAFFVYMSIFVCMHSVSRFWATGSLVSGKLWVFFPGIFFGGEHLVYIFRKHFGKKALGRWIFAHQRSPDFFNAVVRDAAGGQEIPLEQVVMVGLDQGGMSCSFDRSCHP